MLNKKLVQLNKDDSFWIIDKIEPLDCYDQLMKTDHLFQTFIISDNEYRVFVGKN